MHAETFRGHLEAVALPNVVNGGLLKHVRACPHLPQSSIVAAPLHDPGGLVGRGLSQAPQGRARPAYGLTAACSAGLRRAGQASSVLAAAEGSLLQLCCCRCMPAEGLSLLHPAHG